MQKVRKYKLLRTHKILNTDKKKSSPCRLRYGGYKFLYTKNTGLALLYFLTLLILCSIVTIAISGIVVEAVSPDLTENAGLSTVVIMLIIFVPPVTLFELTCNKLFVREGYGVIRSKYVEVVLNGKTRYVPYEKIRRVTQVRGLWHMSIRGERNISFWNPVGIRNMLAENDRLVMLQIAINKKVDSSRIV